MLRIYMYIFAEEDQQRITTKTNNNQKEIDRRKKKLNPTSEYTKRKYTSSPIMK